MDRIKTLFALCLLCISLQSCQQELAKDASSLLCGAKQTEAYLPSLEGKRVALVANHASLLGDMHLADSLLSLGVDIVKVFGPEHGFRGSADAGETVDSDVDTKTGLPVISLYGSNKKTITAKP